MNANSSFFFSSRCYFCCGCGRIGDSSGGGGVGVGGWINHLRRQRNFLFLFFKQQGEEKKPAKLAVHELDLARLYM